MKRIHEVDLLVISYFMNITSHRKDLNVEILKELINIPLNDLASNFLKKLDKQETKTGMLLKRLKPISRDLKV